MSLQEARKKIDTVDSKIKELFKLRMEAADDVVHAKAETCDKIFKPDREADIVDRLTKDVDPSIKKEYTAFIKKIMQVSRKYQYGKMLELLNCFNLEFTTETAKVDKVVTFDLNSKEDSLYDLLLKDKLFISAVKEDKKEGKVTISLSKTLTVNNSHNRIYVAFSCKNGANGLGTVLSMISDYQFNLKEIKTIFDEKSPGGCIFLGEIEANLLEKEAQALVYQLQEECEFIQVLGSYEA